MEFFSLGEVKTTLPLTRYKSTPTNVQKMDGGGIGFVEQLPLGRLEPRFINPGAIFIGTLADGATFYKDEIVAIAPLKTIEKLYKLAQQLEEPIINSEIPIESPAPAPMNTSLNILKRFE